MKDRKKSVYVKDGERDKVRIEASHPATSRGDTHSKLYSFYNSITPDRNMVAREVEKKTLLTAT